MTISPAPAPGPTSAAAPPDAGATAVDPAALARWSGAVPSPGPAADGLAAAARTLTTALHALLPAGPGRPPGGRSAPLAAVLAEHWTGLGRGWARDVEEHTAHVAVTGAALAEVDRAYDTRGPRR